MYQKYADSQVKRRPCCSASRPPQLEAAGCCCQQRWDVAAAFCDWFIADTGCHAHGLLPGTFVHPFYGGRSAGWSVTMSQPRCVVPLLLTPAQGWRVSLMSESLAEAGGYKECVLQITGEK